MYPPYSELASTIVAVNYSICYRLSLRNQECFYAEKTATNWPQYFSYKLAVETNTEFIFPRGCPARGCMFYGARITDETIVL